MSELLQMMQKYKNSKIALYGLGIETEKMLNKFGSQFDIIGLLDGYREDGVMYGKRIISFQEAVNSGVSLILVIARPGSCRAIAKKISQACISNQIDLMDVRGRDLCEVHTVCYDLNNVQGITKGQLVRLAERVGVLSVDLFDTLVMRNTLYYTDIFDIINSRLKNQGIYFDDFEKKRIDAEKSLAGSGAPTLEDIYSYMLEKYGLQGITADRLAQMEWEIDFELVVPRREFCELMELQYRAGKLVYIVSDSYYNRNRIEKLLAKCGIIYYTDVFVSCEYNMGKTQGLFEKLKERLGGKACLHIGDDIVTDIEAAINSGVEACRIYSGLDLLEATGYLGIGDRIINLSDRIKAGIFTAKLFNSPFQFEAVDKRIGIGEAFDIGYLLFAPMITDFVLWFQKQVKQYGLQNIWFCARDGYLIKMLYDELSGKDTSEYFLTSRIAVVRAGIENDEDISYVGSMKFAGSLAEQLQERFGIVLQNENHIKMESKQLYDYRREILDNTQAYRHNYQAYISSINIDDNDIAFFDFVAKGTCQLFVQRFIPNHLKGLYFLQLEKENIGGNLDIIPFYSAQELENSAIYENYYILETVLTSDQPSVIGFDTKGKALYAEETRNSKDIECSRIVQKGICSYFHIYLKLCPEEERCQNKKLDEVLLELIHGIEIRDDAFRKMKVEDQFFNRYTEMGDLL